MCKGYQTSLDYYFVQFNTTANYNFIINTIIKDETLAKMIYWKGLDFPGLPNKMSTYLYAVNCMLIENMQCN